MTSTDLLETTTLRVRPDRTEPLEALIAAAGPHLVAVLDVGSAANGDLLVVLPAPAARLPELQTAPGGLTAGEAVTVLVPLAQALHRMHEQGVAHGGIGAPAVVLDADGSPAWAAPESPTLLKRSGPLRFEDRVAADTAAFRGLCAALLDPVGIRVPDGDRPEVLARALFAVAPAEPVRLVRPVESWLVTTPARLVPALPAVPAPAASERHGRLPAVVLAMARTVRARVWLALGAVTALLVGALLVLPSGDDGGPAAAAAADRPAPSRSTAVVPSPPVVAARSLDGRRAMPALLAERDRCLASGSAACLRRVDAAGSPVLQADLDAVTAGTDGVRVDRAKLTVPAGDGGTALGTSEEATVLAVREQSGWRLRDVVAAPPAER